jgi:YfiH family protein
VTDWIESEEAIAAVDSLLGAVGLEHGRRASRAGTWLAGERKARPRASSSAKKESSGDALALLRVSAFDALPWLEYGFSNRSGGVSTIYSGGARGELNLGWTKEDDPAAVAENRFRFVKAIGAAAPSDRRRRATQKAKSSRLVTLRQIHSGLLRVLGEKELEAELATPDGRAVLRGDGMMTDQPGILLGIHTADCVPVLIADPKRRAVAGFHAGWRGTLRRIVEHGVGTMRLAYGSAPEDLIAVVGPAIGACCYSVGEEVRFEFESQFAYAPELFSEVFDSDPVREKYPLLFLTARAPGHSPIGPQLHINLAEANRRQLLDSGLKPGNVHLTGECTACAGLPGVRRYFSHRAEHGFAGRMMSAIGVKTA